MKQSTVVRLAVLLLVLSFAIFATAQSDSARLTGTITDAQGAVVANAAITLTNLGTGRVLMVQSGAAGEYNFNALPPGTYRVEVKSPSFKVVTQTITLQVTQVAAANFQLEPGAVSETVEVKSDVPLVESASSNISEVVQGRQVTELPLNGRNFTQLATLVPGVTRGVVDGHVSGASGDAETFRYGTSGGAALTVNGLRPQANNFLLDGIDNNESLVNTIIFFPPAEAIQEFRVDTSIAPAQFGRAGGGVVNSSIKSGTNSLHGSAFFFTRNDNLDARRYFDRKYDANNKEIPKPEFRRHQFGGTIGGAIIKNKLFFFGDYQGWRQFEPGSGIEYPTVPTEKMRHGDFSEMLAHPQFPNSPLGCGNGWICDPTTGQQFPGNIIPTARLNAAAVKYLNAFPMANCTNAMDPNCHEVVNNYKVQRTRIQNFDDFDVRTDWNISQNDTLFGRFSYGKDESVTSSRLPALPAGWGSGSNINHPRGLAIGETHIFNPNLINEFRFGFARTKFGYVPPFNDQMVSKELGIANANTIDLLGGGALIGGWNSQLEYTGDEGPYLVPQNTFQYSDTLSWTKGNHVVKFGGTIIRRQVNMFRPRMGKGFFFYAGNGSGWDDLPPVNSPSLPDYPHRGYITGHELADMLAGFTARYEVGPANGMQGTRNWETGYFVQDDWRVGRKLTVNMGLRYDLYTWPLEVQDRQANFDVATGKMLLAGENGASRAFVNADKNNFAPRIGFAYDVMGNGKTVVRGGYGIFYFLDRGGINNQLAQNPPFTGTTSYRYDQGYRVTFTGMGCAPGATAPGCANLPVVTNNDPALATGSLPAKNFDSFNLNNPTGVNVFAVLPSNKNSMVQQWNVQIQRELASNMAVSVAYVGTSGDKLMTYYNMNKSDIKTGLRLFPNLNQVNVQDSRGESVYHGLQARLDRRMTKGLQFTASYTWSHAIDDSTDAFDNNSGIMDFRYMEYERASSSFDTRQRFVLSTIYELPFGKGRTFLGNMPGIAEAILGGWQTNAILTLQSGLPFDVTMNNGSRRPQIVGTPDNPEKVEKWFDTTVFAAPPATAPSNLRRNAFVGPGTKLVDFSLFKDFSVTERVKTQFRAEFYNLFNTPQFAQPVANYDDSNFGRLNNVRQGTERQIQFALRLMF
ncbi:MAG TPA: TonB-dependent receptor [Terriglobales bacterium]|nr:TonB-dependent receptor [Terriglobales bacterium]